MDHFNDDPNEIKIEPISPYDENLIGACASYPDPAPMTQQLLISDSPLFSTWLPSTQELMTSLTGANEHRDRVKNETSDCDVMGSSHGTRTALKNKIQSGRRARGQEDLVVKFESNTNNELTEVDVTRRERRKEQNRRAARKCRVKKRELQSVAKEQFESLIQENRYLVAETSELKTEVDKIKTILKEHENSGLCKLVGSKSSQSSQTLVCHQGSHVTCGLHSRSLEKKEEDSINQIAKELEMGSYTPTCPIADIGAELIDDLLESEGFSSSDTFQDLSHHIAQGDEALSMETGTGSDALGALPVSNDNFPIAFLNLFEEKPRGVRNLTPEFTRCANQEAPNPAHYLSLQESLINQQQQQQHQYQPQQLLLQHTTTPPPPPYDSTPKTTTGQLSPNQILLPSESLDVLQGSAVVGLGLGQQILAQRFVDSLSLGYNESLSQGRNESFPISPISSCTSPQSVNSPLSVNSPSFFNSPPESHRLSTGEPGCRQTPSPHYVFRFPPDARFSPSS